MPIFLSNSPVASTDPPSQEETMWSLMIALAATAALAAADTPQPAATAGKEPKPSASATTAAPAPTVPEQVKGLEERCAQTAQARAERHAQKSLHQRLGGDEKIHGLIREVVRLHLENPSIRHFFEGKDKELVATRVAEFLISGTGGANVYEGPGLRASHESMKLTDADFLSAGGDVMKAMKNLGYAEPEIDEVVCALVALREQVVLPAGAENAAKRPATAGEPTKTRAAAESGSKQ
jgi:hemoglobin